MYRFWTSDFRFVSILTLFVKPFSFIFPKKMREMINLMPANFPKKTLPEMEVYSAKGRKKPIARVALLV